MRQRDDEEMRETYVSDPGGDDQTSLVSLSLSSFEDGSDRAATNDTKTGELAKSRVETEAVTHTASSSTPIPPL